MILEFNWNAWYAVFGSILKKNQIEYVAKNILGYCLEIALSNNYLGVIIQYSGPKIIIEKIEILFVFFSIKPQLFH